jgi:hypothetical protein
VAEAFAFLNRFILSLLGFPLVAWLWHRHGGENLGFSIVVMAIPVVFGYLVPGLAIIWLKFWTIHSRFSIKGIQVHQGFIYGSGLALDAWVADHARFGHPIADVVLTCVLTGFIVGFTGWFIDIAGVKAGRIRIDNPMSRLGKNPETIVTYYAPSCYFALGASYMLAIHLAREVLVNQGRNSWAAALGAFILGFFLTSIPCIVLYLQLQYRKVVS